MPEFPSPSELVLERQADHTLVAGALAAITPMVHEDYWTYRVRVSEDQAILGFPKFSTISVGFAQEKDWNTNLPYTCTTTAIRDHIGHNRGDDRIANEVIDQAIALIQEAIRSDLAPDSPDVCPLCTRIRNGMYDASRHGCVTFEPLNPVADGHRLVVPVRHAANASADPQPAALAMRFAAELVAERRIQANIITSIGRDASQSVQHTHIHIVPRTAGDGLTLPWTGQVHDA